MAVFADKLTVFIAQQEKSLAELEERYLDEKVRLVNQIQAAKAALVGVRDPKVEALIDALKVAGIQIRTE